MDISRRSPGEPEGPPDSAAAAGADAGPKARDRRRARRRHRSLLALPVRRGGRHAGDGRHDHGHAAQGRRRSRPAAGHVVDHDDRHDAAERGADDPDLRHRQRAPARPRPALGADGPVRGGLRPGLGRLQHRRDIGAMGPRERGAALADGHVGDQRAAGRRAVPRRRPLPADAAEARLPHRLPLALRLRRQPLARRRPRRPAHGRSSTASPASAAAGS